MEDSSHSDIPLPPPEAPRGPVRRWGWFLIVLAAVLALVIVSFWYCSTAVTRPKAPCVAQPASLDLQGTVSGTTCPEGGTTSKYRCQNITQKLNELFRRKNH